MRLKRSLHYGKGEKKMPLASPYTEFALPFPIEALGANNSVLRLSAFYNHYEKGEGT